MDQRVPFLCQHRQLNGLGPECWSKCRPAPVTIEPAVPVERAPKVRKAAAAVTPNAAPAVTPNSGAGESRKRGRPRVLSDEQRREKVRQRVAGWRAAKAGKVASR